MMSVEFSLKELLIEINKTIDNLDSKVDKLEEKIDTRFERVFTEINLVDVNMVRIENELKGEIEAFNERLGTIEAQLKVAIETTNAKSLGIGKRIDTHKFISRGVLVGLILIISGGFTRIFGFVS